MTWQKGMDFFTRWFVLIFYRKQNSLNLKTLNIWTLWLCQSSQCHRLSKCVICKGNWKGSSIVRMIFNANLWNDQSLLFINMISHLHIPLESLINTAKWTYSSLCFNEANSGWMETMRTAEYIMLQTQRMIIMWVTLGLLWQWGKC